jgi:hypothetical protein
MRVRIVWLLRGQSADARMCALQRVPWRKTNRALLSAEMVQTVLEAALQPGLLRAYHIQLRYMQ